MQFCYLDMFLFFISDHKPRDCLTILRLQMGHCIIKLACEDVFAYLWW